MLLQTVFIIDRPTGFLAKMKQIGSCVVWSVVTLSFRPIIIIIVIAVVYVVNASIIISS